MAPTNIKTFELKIGKTGVVIIVVGMAVLLSISFLFGVDVGKNIDTYPEQISTIPKKMMSFLWRPDNVNTNVANRFNVHQPPSAKNDDIDLTFYNALTNQNGSGGISMDDVQQPPVDETVVFDFKKKSFEADISSDDPNQHDLKVRNEQHESIIEDRAAEIKNESNEAPQKSGKFIIQAASLRNKAQADKIKKKILSLGYQASVVRMDLKDKGVVFRVMTSEFSNRDQAEKASKK